MGVEKYESGSINVNGLSALIRKELVKSFEEERLDIMQIQETHIKSCGVIDCMIGSESEV